MKKILKKVLKLILIVLAIFIAFSFCLYILFELLNTSGYTEEQLRVFCNDSTKMEEMNLTILQCMTVW